MWKKTILKLTVVYSLIFFGFLALFSGGLYIWVNSALGESYVEQVRGQVEQVDNTETSSRQSKAAQIAADIAIDHFRNILLAVDGIAVILVPFGSYFLTKRTLRPLIASQEQQKQFIANASHELRTPLAVLNGELELSLRKPRSTTDYKKTIISSKQEVNHMVHLTQELLLLAQLDEATTTLPEMATINVSELLNDIRQQSSVKLKDRSLSLLIICPETIVAIASPTLLTVAISNIVDNAIRYSNAGSEIKISAVMTAQNRPLITIEDRGAGIPIQQQAHLFDRFYQAKNDRNSEGFGLGLAITDKIVKLHDGKVSFTSSDSETIFTILL